MVPYPLLGQVYIYSFLSLFIYVVLHIFLSIVEEAYFTVKEERQTPAESYMHVHTTTADDFVWEESVTSRTLNLKHYSLKVVKIKLN